MKCDKFLVIDGSQCVQTLHLVSGLSDEGNCVVSCVERSDNIGNLLLDGEARYLRCSFDRTVVYSVVSSDLFKTHPPTPSVSLYIVCLV